ncbi:thiol-disulfide oxidoreductase DCC [Halobacteriales archaeon QS_8_69_26]|nr:MAG: thiol-disulfide oxidoreductase DCC [Halobacteriales archaeon QS_8_69_26]
MTDSETPPGNEADPAGEDAVPVEEFEPVPEGDDSPVASAESPEADDVVPEGGAVVLFDGVCNLCSGFVGVLIPRDPEGRLRYASLQSPVADDLTADCGHEATLDSIVLVEEDACYTKSDAVLRIAGHLGGWYSLLRVARVVPRPVRDVVYDLVARYRYRVFGRKDRCMVPTEDVRSRFVGDPTAVPDPSDPEA